jgi:hypothetical protein
MSHTLTTAPPPPPPAVRPSRLITLQGLVSFAHKHQLAGPRSVDFTQGGTINMCLTTRDEFAAWCAAFRVRHDDFDGFQVSRPCDWAGWRVVLLHHDSDADR